MDIKPVSYIWLRLFKENPIPKNGVIVEVAPGYEKKIGDALALSGFKGTIILVEPDKAAAMHVKRLYKSILPKQASVKIVTKFLQDVLIGKDVPYHVDALVANHPFDDMAIAFAMHGKEPSLFSKERESGTKLVTDIKKLYDSVSNKDYIHGILATIIIWKDFIQKLKPNLFIVSQYPSQKLAIKKLIKRQNSGFVVIDLIKNYYENYLKHLYQNKFFGQQGDPAWWVVAYKPYVDLATDLEKKPDAIKRLGNSIFVPQRAKRLNPNEYKVIYVDNKYFKKYGYEGDAVEQIKRFAIALDHKKGGAGAITTYADRQKDSTGIGLTGNIGSGRAVYYGDKFNVMGVGKTTLCTSSIPSHSTGTMETIGALRRVVLSRWINHFTKAAVRHLGVIALKKTTRVKWDPNPIPLSLLVRIDNGALDRPSHVEYSPKIKYEFKKTLDAYAKLDAQYFAYRIILGAWSTGNYSLSGNIIDLESASFTKYRGPYNTSSVKYPDNYFGYEGIGFVKILKQMANAKKIHDLNIEKTFYKKRRKYLAGCFLSLLGIDEVHSEIFMSRYSEQVMEISDQFEKLSKKIRPEKTNLNLYTSISEDNDPTLLDMSNLFRNLGKLFYASDREKKAIKYLVRKQALKKIRPDKTCEPQLMSNSHINLGEIFLKENVVVTHKTLDDFISQTRSFIHDLFRLIEKIDSEECLPKNSYWNDELRVINQNFPTLDILNKKLKYWVEKYRIGRISSGTLGKEIEKLCELPDYPTGENFEFKNIPLIDYLKPNRREQKILSSHIKTIDYKKGEIVVREGDAADSLFILVQGTCHVSIKNAEIARISNRGAIIGEAVVFDEKKKRTATVLTETPCRLLKIERNDLRKNKPIYQKLRRILKNILTQRMNGVGNKVFGLEIFNGIDPEYVRLFLADKASDKGFATGDYLIKQGKNTPGIYVLTHGSVILSQSRPDSETDLIELEDKPLEQGLFGERSIILNEGAICTVKANKNVKTLFVKKSDFLKLLDHYPQLLRNCLNHITDYSRLNKQRASLISNIEERILSSK